MYYPYLRGKQFELIALREFSNENPTPTHVCPIIEPVKSSFNGLNTAISTLSSNNVHFAIILNPSNGDFKRIRQDILENVPILTELIGKWTPAFIVSDDAASIEQYISSHNLNKVMLIFPYSTDLSNADIIRLLDMKEIRYVVANLKGDRKNKKRLIDDGRLLIRLDDQFNEQPRNADYLDIPEEKFTEEHRYYKDDGYSGFSDYTTLPSSFKESGMLPYAVAIHLTYQKNDDEIFIRHFVSDHNDDNTNIPGKFYEAAKKMATFFAGKENTTATMELITLLESNRYPGLGVLKKLSIKNHLELVEKFLEGQQ